MRHKLARKQFSPAQIEAVTAWLKNKKLLNDAQFAHDYSVSVLRTKAVGPRWLRGKLKERGIAAEIIADTLAGTLPAAAEKNLLERAAQQWQKTHVPTAGSREKLGRFLLARGFSPALVTAYLFKS